MRLDSPTRSRPSPVGAVREPPSELLPFTVGLDSPELAERSNAAEANSGPLEIIGHLPPGAVARE